MDLKRKSHLRDSNPNPPVLRPHSTMHAKCKSTQHRKLLEGSSVSSSVFLLILQKVFFQLIRPYCNFFLRKRRSSSHRSGSGSNNNISNNNNNLETSEDILEAEDSACSYEGLALAPQGGDHEFPPTPEDCEPNPRGVISGISALTAMSEVILSAKPKQIGKAPKCTF